MAVACGTTNNTGNTPPSPTPVPVLTGNPTSAVTLNEDGSSLVYPYLQLMVPAITAKYSNITLAPAPGGSGKGINDAINGTVQMGGSDAYLSDQQATANPGLLNIPIVVSAQAVYYNLPGISNLKLSGSVLAKMYEGSITKWNDAAIASLNPGVTLPSTTVVPVRRVDSSGDTFLFTSFLSATDQTWANGPAYNTSVSWPTAAKNELTANGNPAMAQVCGQTPGCIAYIGVSAEAQATAANIEMAQLQNKAGNFVTPSSSTMAAAVSASASSTPADLRQSLIYEGGAQSYPIVNYEYLMTPKAQKDANTALAVRTFLTWAIDPSGGATSANLGKANFIALPSNVVSKVRADIAQIGT